MLLQKMKDFHWDSTKEIYKEGIDSNKATIVKVLPTFHSWNEEHDPHLRFVAELNGKIVGFIALHGSMDKSVGEISIYVKTGYKRQGVGTLLLCKMQKESCTQDYKVLRSKIFIDNIASIMLHKKMGFMLKEITKLNGDMRDVCIYEWEAL